MGAPSNAYSGQKLTDHLIGVSKQDNSLALKLSAYGSNIKTLFYLDVLLIADKSGQTFLGAVEENGVFYPFHNPARFSKIRLSKNGIKYIVLNDAGLNTKGFSVPNNGEAVFGIGPRVTMGYRSAYWVDTDGIVLEFKKNSESTWLSIAVKGFIAQNTESQELVAFNNATTPYQPGDILNVRTQHTNAEGTYTSSVLTFQVPTPSANFSTDAAYASYAFANWNAQTNVYNYKFSSFSYDIGTLVTLQNGSPAGVGYYANATTWFRTATNGALQTEIVAAGSVGSWPSGDPATGPGYGTVTWFHKAANTYQNACLFLSGNANTPVTTYLRSSNNLYYNDTAFSTLTNGIFYTSTTNFVQIFNGQLIQEGDCTNGWHVIEES